jgi:WG containing repeat
MRTLLASLCLALLVLSLTVSAYSKNTDQSISVVRGSSAESKWGYIDKTGKVAIGGQYDDADSFSEGLAAVCSGDKAGYIDKSGNEVIKKQFQVADSFSEGLAPVELPTEGDLVQQFGEDSGNKWGYIDKAGKFVIKPTFTSAGPFKKGLAAVSTGGSGSKSYGFIDRDGHFVIEPRFYFAFPFSEDLAAVIENGFTNFSSTGGACSSDGQWTFIDPSGKTSVTPLTNELIPSFSDGLVPVAIGFWQGVNIPSKWGFINKSGMFAIKPQFSEASGFSEGLAAVHSGEWKEMGHDIKSWMPKDWIYVDTAGQKAIAKSFEGADPFSDGMASIKLKGMWGYIDKTGTIVIEPKFAASKAFHDGLAPVEFAAKDQ